VEVGMVETGGRVHGVPTMFCYILSGFCHILPIGQVECSGGWNGRNRWARAGCHRVVP